MTTPCVQLTHGVLAACAAIVAVHGPEQSRERLSGALLAALDALPDPEPEQVPESPPESASDRRTAPKETQA